MVFVHTQLCLQLGRFAYAHGKSTTAHERLLQQRIGSRQTVSSSVSCAYSLDGSGKVLYPQNLIRKIPTEVVISAGCLQ